MDATMGHDDISWIRDRLTAIGDSNAALVATTARMEKQIAELSEKVDRRNTHGCAQHCEFQRRVTDLENRPKEMLDRAGTLAAIAGVIGGGIVWIAGKLTGCP